MRIVNVSLNGAEFTLQLREVINVDCAGLSREQIEAKVEAATAEQAAKPAGSGVFTVEATDSAALVTITRLWLAGASTEAIAKALELGLLPKK